MASISVRESTPDDAERVSLCVASVAQERRYLDTTAGFSVEQTREFLATLRKNNGIQLIAVDDSDDTVVGWCDAAPLPQEGQRHICQLGLGVRKPNRGQGLGSKLLREVIRRVFADNSGFLRIQLEVFTSNDAAQKLYQQNGFVTEDQKDDRFVMSLSRENWKADCQPVSQNGKTDVRSET